MKKTKKVFSGLVFLVTICFSLLPMYPVLAVSFITLDSFSGHPATITISGGGWTEGETVSIYLNSISGSPVASALVGSDSFFEPLAVNIPPDAPQGPLPIIAVGSANNEQQENSYYVVPFTPSTTISGNNTPGSMLSIDGQGFYSNETVQFNMNGLAMGTATADAEGNFVGGQATIPNVAPDTYQISAIGQSSQAQAITYFYVGGFYPSVTPSTYYLLPTQVINFSGSGFAANEIIDIFEGQNQTPLSSITADSAGIFNDAGNITIPLNFAGTKTFRLVGRVSNGVAGTDITIGSFNPYTTPSTYYILPGQTLTFSGGGFAANEPVNILESQSQTSLASFVADEEGNFTNTGAIIIPFGWEGTGRTFRLIGQTGGGISETGIIVGQFNSLVSPSLYHLNAGQNISFSGTGFAPQEIVNITEGQNPTVLAALTTDSDGNFTDDGIFTIPFNWSGSERTFHFVGQSSNTQADVVIMVAEFMPLVSPSNYYLFPGAEISFSGTGFGMNENITITRGQDNTVLATIVSGNMGNFENDGTFIIPFNWIGQQTLHFTGESSRAATDVEITTASFNPLIFPSTYYLSPGHELTISGTGFAPEEMVDISMGTTGTPITVMTSSTGEFSDAGPFVAPLSGNTLLITATGQDSGVAASVEITLANLYPSVSPDKWYFPSGSDITFEGTGFAPGEQVVATSGTGTMLAAISTDALGNFASLTASTEFGQDRQATYTFTGLKSNATALVTVTIAALQPFVSLDNYYAAPNTTIHATGIGFSPNEQVTVTIGSSTTTAAADNTGTVSSTPITIPLNITGETASITMTGNLSNASASTQLTLAPFLTQVIPSTWYTAPGTTIVFTGTGFVSLESININLNGSPVTSTIADAAGNFTSPEITIPITATQAHFVITGVDSQNPSTIDISLAGFTPLVTPSTWYIPAGSSLTFTGTQFASGEIINIMLNDSPIDSVSANAAGEFATKSINIPVSATTANFVFNGGASGASVSVPITLAPFSPGIQLSTYYDNGGTPLTITGTGFASNEDVNIIFGEQILGTALANENGDFTFETVVPYLPAAEHLIQAIGQNSGAIAMASFINPLVYVSVELGSYAGAPGSTINFVGNGFLPGETVDITTDRTGITVVHSFAADGAGTFNNSGYAIPADFAGGPLTIVIKGQHSLAPIGIVYYVTGG